MAAELASTPAAAKQAAQPGSACRPRREAARPAARRPARGRVSRGLSLILEAVKNEASAHDEHTAERYYAPVLPRCGGDADDSALLITCSDVDTAATSARTPPAAGELSDVLLGSTPAALLGGALLAPDALLCQLVRGLVAHHLRCHDALLLAAAAAAQAQQKA